MSRIRASRVAEQIKKELSQIIQKELKDPRVGFVTITDVEMSTDLKTAKVYVSVFGEDQEKEQTLACLEKAKGFMRSEVGSQIHLRHVPEMTFVVDETLDYSDRINRLIEDVNQEKKDE
jgi:ribosome-binding factor A